MSTVFIIERQIPPTAKRSVLSYYTGVHRREASEGSCSFIASYRQVVVPVLRANRYKGVSLNFYACHFLLVEAPLWQVKQSSWLKSMYIRREMLFTPSPGQQWELAAKGITVRGELAAPMWEKKTKCVENTIINVRCPPAKHCLVCCYSSLTIFANAGMLWH